MTIGHGSVVAAGAVVTKNNLIVLDDNTDNRDNGITVATEKLLFLYIVVPCRKYIITYWRAEDDFSHFDSFWTGLAETVFCDRWDRR